MDKEYRKLVEQFTNDIFENSAAKIEEAYKQQNKDQEQLLNMIAKVLLTYTIADAVLTLGANDKKPLKNKFSVAIVEIAKGQFSNEKDLMNEILTTAAKDKYYSNGYILQHGMDFNLQKITNKQINDIVDKMIDGELWSDRLWKNKKELESSLKKEVESFLNGKTNVNEIEKSIKKRFNQNAFNTHRLVQSEVTKCQSGANELFAEEHEIEWQLYSATLDSKTSSFCRKHDGKPYKIDDPDKPIPGVNTHPFCRSCLINLPSKDWKPKFRRDQENNKIIDWTTYESWKANNNI